MTLQALKKLKAVKKAEKQKTEKIIAVGKKQTDLILLEESVMREKLQDILKTKQKKDRIVLLDNLLKEKNAFFTRKPFILKFKILSVYLQDDFIKKYIKQNQKYFDYYNLWFSEQEDEEDEEDKKIIKEQDKEEDRYKEIQKYIYNNALEYAKKLGVERTDETTVIKNIINFEINLLISAYINEYNIEVDLDPEDVDYNVKIVLKRIIKPLKKALKKIGLNISVMKEVDLFQIEDKKLVKNTLKDCKKFLNFLKQDKSIRYEDILAKVNYTINHPRIFLQDIKNKKMYEINTEIYGIYVDISKLLNIEEAEKLSVIELSKKISRKESLYFSRNEFLQLKNDKELLYNEAQRLGLLSDEPEEINIIKILLAKSQQKQKSEKQKSQIQYEIPKIDIKNIKEQTDDVIIGKRSKNLQSEKAVIIGKDFLSSTLDKKLKDQMQSKKIDEKAVIIGKDFLSSTLLKISPYMIDYKPESKYIDDVLKEKIQEEQDIYNFFLDISDLCVYILLEKALIFKDRIKNKYYIPEILLQLSPFDKLPEIFNSDNIKAQELFSSYIDSSKNIFVAQMINYYNNSNKQDILDKWKTNVIDFTKRKPIVIEKSIENELLLESEYTDFDLYGKCENKQDIINEPVHNLVYYNDESDNKMYCFKITELVKNIKENIRLVNQYNGVQLSQDFVNSIKNKYNIYYEDDKTIEKKTNENELKLLQMQHKNTGQFEIKLVIPNLWDLVNENVEKIERSLNRENKQDQEEKAYIDEQQKQEKTYTNDKEEKKKEKTLKNIYELLEKEEKEEKEEKKPVNRQGSGLYIVKYKDGSEEEMFLDNVSIEKLIKKDKNILSFTFKKTDKNILSFTTTNKCCVCSKEQCNFKSIDYNGQTVQQLNFCSTDCMRKKTFKKLKKHK